MTWAEDQLREIVAEEREEAEREQNMSENAMGPSALREAAQNGSRTSIESAFEILNQTIESLFDEIHRLGNRVSPILLDPDTQKEGPTATPEYGSTVRGQIVQAIERLNNACRDLSNYTARVDL